jgi:hypothetical protein
MSNIPSPLTLDLTNTRAFKTWLYQLWLSTGGTTNSSLDDIDVYLATPAIDVINGSQLDQVLLMQIRDELSEINKKLDEIQINERTVLDDVNKKLDELRINERSALDEVNKKIDDVVLLLGATL